jgi:polar amino acid transport system substrate-binding protein
MKSLLTAALTAFALFWAAPLALADTSPPPPTLVPGVLTVGISMPSPGFEVGAVRGHGVVFARGLEIDLANAIAARLGIPRVVFYQEPQFPRLLGPGPKPWDLALAEVTVTPERAANVAFSVPYLAADQGVLLRRGLGTTPHTIAQLAKLRLCTQSGTTSATLLTTQVNPVKPAKFYGNTTRLLDALQTGRCDAVVYDAPILATLRAQVPWRYGPLAGVIQTQESYAAVLPTGSALLPAVDDAITAIIDQGTLAAISKRWLSTDLSKLPVLR